MPVPTRYKFKRGMSATDFRTRLNNFFQHYKELLDKDTTGLDSDNVNKISADKVTNTAETLSEPSPDSSVSGEQVRTRAKKYSGGLTFNSRVILNPSDWVTLGSAANPDVSGGIFFTTSGTRSTNITSFSNGVTGQFIFVNIAGLKSTYAGEIIVDNASIQNFNSDNMVSDTPGVGEYLSRVNGYYYDGSVWHQFFQGGATQ